MKRFGLLTLLGILFLTPGFLAYLFYTHPQWLSGKTSHKGELYSPTLPLPALQTSIFGSISQSSKAVSEKEENPIRLSQRPKNKWHLILWSPESCGKACLAKLSELARMKLALGRRLYRVEQTLLIKATDSLENDILAMLKEQQINLLQITKKEPKELSDSISQILIANPTGNVVLSYTSDISLKDLFHDLHHLLTVDNHES